ncbi:MAG: HEXXH motif-containing putative peptide modification protein [Pseudomonadota bacterium]|nr:HEXXH motif-containing putative peptide modification protein [Pseudomonadota bacterium]
MGELSDRVRVSLETPNNNPWFPELTSQLTELAWDNLGKDIGLTTDTYGTARVLSGNVSISRDVIKYLLTDQVVCETPLTIDIEVLPQEQAAQYLDAGITFYLPNELLNTTVTGCVEDAISILKRVPSLLSTVTTLIRSLHLIKPADSDYDVSFSEPKAPFSVFVSVPEKRVPNDAIRVAESILHEAMHNQLTIIEQIVPLIRSSGKKYFSPWRGTHRPAQGILHALYVFRVIDRFLASLSSLRSFRGEFQEYLQGRRNDIHRQINETRSFESSSELTMIGARFVRGLFSVSLILPLSSNSYRTLADSPSAEITCSDNL